MGPCVVHVQVPLCMCVTGKEFGRLHNLHGHMHMHNNSKPYVCFCGSSFTLKGQPCSLSSSCCCCFCGMGFKQDVLGRNQNDNSDNDDSDDCIDSDDNKSNFCRAVWHQWYLHSNKNEDNNSNKSNLGRAIWHQYQYFNISDPWCNLLFDF